MKFIQLLGLCLCPALAIAQELAPLEMEDVDYSDFPRMTSANDTAVKLFMWQQLKEDLYISHPEGYKRIQPMRESLSMPHYYAGQGPLIFYRRTLNDEGEVIYLPVAQCELPGGSRDYIVVLIRRDGSYRAVAIDMSERGQALGTVRFINLTPARLVVLLKDERSSLEPGGSVTSDFDSDELSFFNFKVGAMYEGQPSMIFSSRYPFRGKMRMLFIGYAVNPASSMDTTFRVLSHRDRGPEARPLLSQ